MKIQQQNRRMKPSYARSVRRTISLPLFLDENANIKMNETKVFDFSKYVQILIQRDTERKATVSL